MDQCERKVRIRQIRNLSEFDEYINKIKNENNKNIINTLVEKTNANMTIRDRTCGFAFHYILTTIMICLENINKDHMKQPEYIDCMTGTMNS